jgi:ATP-dependent protease ClpP protease subunit
MRYATQNSIISVGQLLHEHQTLSDLLEAKSLLERKKQDNKEFMTAIAKVTNKSISQVMKDYERKKFLTPKQACQYGLIDGVIGK